MQWLSSYDRAGQAFCEAFADVLPMIETRLIERLDVEAFSKFILEAWRQAGLGGLGWTGASEEQIHALASRPFVESLLDREGTRPMVFN